MSSTDGASVIIGKIEELEHFINEWEIVPATSYYRSRVLLALMSKALTVGRAVCELVKMGFHGEAYGLSRTLAEIFFTVRYICNRDTEARAEKYFRYTSIIQKEFERLSLLAFHRQHHRDDLLVSDSMGRDPDILECLESRISANRVSIHNYQSVLRIIVIEFSLENHLHYLDRALMGDAPQQVTRVRVNVEMRFPPSEPIPDALRHGVKQIREWFG
jgi:hypothetical protein